MRKPLFLALALLAAASTAARAQAPADTATTYKHQLGLTASPVLDGFFRNNRGLPLGLLYKRQVTPNRALRLGLVGSYRYTKRYDPAPLSNRDFSESASSVQAYVGYEFQKTLLRRWIAYAGLDVGASYGKYNFKEYSERADLVNGILTAFSLYYDRPERTYTAFVRPLAGVRYHLRPFFYVSAEASLPVQYTHYKWSSSTTRTFRDTGSFVDIGEGRFQEHRLSAEFRPVSQISVHYLFGRL